MREDLEASVHTAMGGTSTSTRRLASMASTGAATDADAGAGAAAAAAVAASEEEEAWEEERARVVAQACQQRPQGAAAASAAASAAGGRSEGDQQQVLFVLAQKDFSVTTKQFARTHFCGPMLLQMAGRGGGGYNSEEDGEGEGPLVAFASGAGAGGTPTHARAGGKTGKKGKTAAPRQPKPKDCFLALGVGGFRIVQTGSGNQHAEYHIIVCIDAETHVAWRRYSQFAALMEAACAAHGDSQLPQTWAAWAALERRRKWRRCLNVPYLAGKLAGLEAFLQALVAELASPALLLRFVASAAGEEEKA